jgi:hypothetical protein
MTASMKMAVFWDVAPYSLVVHRRFRVIIALIMEAASMSETSVNFYQTTRRNILEDGHIHNPFMANYFFYKMCFSVAYCG